jgi:hypothetical protein
MWFSIWLERRNWGLLQRVPDRWRVRVIRLSNVLGLPFTRWWIRHPRFPRPSRSLSLSLSLDTLGCIILPSLWSSCRCLWVKWGFSTHIRLTSGVNEINFLLVNSIKPIRPRKYIILNFLALDQLINDPVQIFVRVDNIGWKHHLIILVVVWHKLIESLIPASDSHHTKLAFHFTVNSVGANQVKVVLDESDWDPDVVNLNYLWDLLVQHTILSRVEPVWSNIEKFPAFLLDLNFIKLLLI